MFREDVSRLFVAETVVDVLLASGSLNNAVPDRVTCDLLEHKIPSTFDIRSKHNSIHSRFSNKRFSTILYDAFEILQ